MWSSIEEWYLLTEAPLLRPDAIGRICYCGSILTDVHRQRGVTLFELLVVLAIVALAAALAPPFLTTVRTGFEVRAQAQAIGDAARLARSRAILGGRASVVEIDPSGSRFRSDADPDWTSLPRGVALRLDLPGGALDEVGSIVYYPDGSSSAGTVIVSAGDRTWRVRAAINGKIHIEKTSP